MNTKIKELFLKYLTPIWKYLLALIIVFLGGVCFFKALVIGQNISDAHSLHYQWKSSGNLLELDNQAYLSLLKWQSQLENGFQGRLIQGITSQTSQMKETFYKTSEVQRVSVNELENLLSIFSDEGAQGLSLTLFECVKKNSFYEIKYEFLSRELK